MFNKRFLKNFLKIFLVLLVAVAMFVAFTYQLSIRALENEIQSIYQNAIYDIQFRMEEILNQARYLSSYLIVDEEIRLFFSHNEPHSLINGYYSVVNSKLNCHAVPYIDSIVLYAPKHNRMISSISGGMHYDMDTAISELAWVDTSWIDAVNAMDSRESDIILRAKNNNWPYYLSVVNNWSQGGVDSSVIVNINLIKLYNYLLSENNFITQLYIVDDDNRVILQEDQQSLFVPVTEVSQLQLYQEKSAFANTTTKDGCSYVYAQAYSQEFGMSFVTFTQINDYYDQLIVVQRTTMLVFIIAFLMALMIAIVYSFMSIKPLKDIQALLDKPLDADQKKYDENVREIADRFISYLQTNTKLQQELDSRLNLLNDTQMQALQAQINPHFLFNTLNAIVLLLENDCGNTHPGIMMLSELSYVLRYSLSDTKVVSIREELDFIKEYLAIMGHRYGAIETNIAADESVFDCAIPKLVFQPLVENSIQHGLAPRFGVAESTLGISVQLISHCYSTGIECPSIHISISDNGVGMDEITLENLRRGLRNYDSAPKEHIGLVNVSHRLYLMFHNEQDICVDSTPGQGTSVQIWIPAKHIDDL